jgi:hypothetical protein
MSYGLLRPKLRSFEPDINRATLVLRFMASTKVLGKRAATPPIGGTPKKAKTVDTRQDAALMLVGVKEGTLRSLLLKAVDHDPRFIDEIEATVKAQARSFHEEVWRASSVMHSFDHERRDQQYDGAFEASNSTSNCRTGSHAARSLEE